MSYRNAPSRSPPFLRLHLPGVFSFSLIAKGAADRPFRSFLPAPVFSNKKAYPKAVLFSPNAAISAPPNMRLFAADALGLKLAAAPAGRTAVIRG